MKLLRGLQRIPELTCGVAATIGNFDGVHLGHQALLKELRRQADAHHLPVLVMLFEPQPGEYFRREKAPARLSTLREKINVLADLGVDYVYCLNFNDYLATMAATEFAKYIVFSLIQAKYLLIGQDFRFGQGRIGDFNLLQQMGNEASCTVECFSDFSMNAQRVSSTKIRQALDQGQLDGAASLLGRSYSICGRVFHGNKRGRQWGIPTANINLSRTTLPLKGVFCVKVERPGNLPLTGVANIGCRPTVDGVKNILEVHIFDFDESLYGEMLKVSFLHKLRDEIKFASVDDLVAQIHMDTAAAKNWFKAIERT
jgi:riboflavin kinase / FMN adenylyltransferase